MTYRQTYSGKKEMRPIDIIPLCTGDHPFVEQFAQICMDSQRKLDEWITKLKNGGIRAAHPDDGWVDRKLNRVHFAYPHFDDGVSIGDKIALGQEWEWRIVEITGKHNGLLFYWTFTP